MNAKAILDRTEYHLRAMRRVALENNDGPEYWAYDAGISTIKVALKVVKREQEQQRRKHTAQLRRAA